VSHASAACIDSQPVKTTRWEARPRYDGGKKIKGRKRHLLVDTLGFVAGRRDYECQCCDGRSRVRHCSATQGARLSTLGDDLGDTSITIMRSTLGGRQSASWRLEVKPVPQGNTGFTVRKRWVVERTMRGPAGLGGIQQRL